MHRLNFHTEGDAPQTQGRPAETSHLRLEGAQTQDPSPKCLSGLVFSLPQQVATSPIPTMYTPKGTFLALTSPLLLCNRAKCCAQRMMLGNSKVASYL